MLAASIALIFVLVTQQADAPVQSSEAVEDARIVDALKITTEWAEKYEFHPAQGATAELLEKPVLRWSNPERGSVHGNVFLWTSQKRPVAIGSLFQWFAPFTHMSHEFHSLCESPMTVERNGRVVWESPAGVTLMDVANAPAVAKTAVQRQIQMRRIVQLLQAKNRQRDQVEFAELRLLTSPIYRYEKTEGVPASGALFTFVQGTDPEVVVWMEARPNEDGVMKWKIAFVAMNSVETKVLRASTEIWMSEKMPWADISRHRKPYTSFNSRRYPIK